jgi:hypothetical protein
MNEALMISPMVKLHLAKIVVSEPISLLKHSSEMGQ